MAKEKDDRLGVIVFGVILSYLTYIYVLKELNGIYADYNGHTYVFLPMYTKETWFNGWISVPYCMWHMTTLFINRVLHVPLESAAAACGCLYTLFAYVVLYWMIGRITTAAGRPEHPLRAAFIAFGMCVLQGFYFSWLDAGGRFLGIYSMNPVHNPTYTCMKGFSLLSLCLIWDIWGAQKKEGYQGIFFRVEKGLKKYYICLAVMLFLSTLAKPTFAEMFIPAVGLVMLAEWISRIRRKDGSAAPYFRHCLLNTFWCAVPALLYILLQFLAYFIWRRDYGGDGSVILTKWLEVWGIYTDNVALSVLLGMAFPLFLVLINGDYFVKSDCGRLALAGYGVGFLEAAVLGEAGTKLTHANFLWPMMSGMLLMFVTAMMRLLVLERTQAETRGKRALLTAAWVLFCIHVLYGLLYMLG